MNITLMAHDKKKELIVQFCIAYKSILARHNLFATATTGRLVMDATGLPITLFLAHSQGGVPNLIIECGERNEETLGELIYFFEYACGLSGYLLDVNPFDQPGVEAYKRNMFALLGKPGYEAERAVLEEKLSRE